MSKRIRELFEQSGLRHYGPDFVDKTDKFTELIVNECVLILESITVPVSESYEDFDNGYNKALLTGSKVIKKHFGVE